MDVDRAKGNGFKPKEGRFRSEDRRKFSPQRAVGRWKGLPRDAGDAPTPEGLRTRLGEALSTLTSRVASLPVAGGCSWVF